jgi:hypothetical protein
MKFLILIICAFLFLGCVPRVYEEKCRPNFNLEGTYKIDRPSEFYTTISRELSDKAPVFNYVKVSKLGKKYYFELINNATLVESFLIKLNKNKNGAYSHSKNQYFFTIILYSRLGGRARFFGINSENNLITYHNNSGTAFLLFIPVAGGGCCNFSSEWQRVENISLPNKNAARDASHP